MTNSQEAAFAGPFEALSVAFLETITHLRPRLHRYYARMTGSTLDVARRILNPLPPVIQVRDNSRRERQWK
jgi:hypothetical protein